MHKHKKTIKLVTSTSNSAYVLMVSPRVASASFYITDVDIGVQPNERSSFLRHFRCSLWTVRLCIHKLLELFAYLSTYVMVRCRFRLLRDLAEVSCCLPNWHFLFLCHCRINAQKRNRKHWTYKVAESKAKFKWKKHKAPIQVNTSYPLCSHGF